MPATPADDPPKYDCLVLSGGGAKGAYGAGAAKAFFAYRKQKKITSPLCLIGASAGALNAAVLAHNGPDDLIRFWTEATNYSVLGVNIRNLKYRGLVNWLKQRVSRGAFSIYPNTSLEQLVSKKVGKTRQPDSHLIIAATDLTEGTLEVFYSSGLIRSLVDADALRPVREQRIAHWFEVESREQLISVLLASSAIPVFFPPVQIDVTAGGRTQSHWYVDGGVGNHTPTREAMYFLRHLDHVRPKSAGVVYCVKQDPPRVVADEDFKFNFIEIMTRTLEVYHHVHMEPIIRGLVRINDEVKDRGKKLDEFQKWLSTQSLDSASAQSIGAWVEENFGTAGGGTPRLNTELIEIEPTSSLGDSLDFDPVSAKENIKSGYQEMLSKLAATGRLDDAEHQLLLKSPIFPAAK